MVAMSEGLQRGRDTGIAGQRMQATGTWNSRVNSSQVQDDKTAEELLQNQEKFDESSVGDRHAGRVYKLWW